jgi:hypothetical protein
MLKGGLMEDDDLDLILASDEILLPSSGFAAAVMDAVRRETAAPAPIPFPWRRALPGLIVSVIVIVSILAGWIVRYGGKIVAEPAPTTRLAPILYNGFATQIGWTMVTLLLTFVLLRIVLRYSDGEA